MARDRKRSQGRRKRSGNAGNPARSRAREIGLDDATIDESGLTDPTPAPDPLKNASAEVDQARAAETGARRGESGDVEMGEDALDEEYMGDEYVPAPDEVEGDQVPLRDLDPAVAEAHAGRPRKQRGKVLTFLGHCVDELRRVQWPNRKQVGQATAVVLGFVVLAGGYLGLMDALWKPIVNAII